MKKHDDDDADDEIEQRCSLLRRIEYPSNGEGKDR